MKRRTFLSIFLGTATLLTPLSVGRWAQAADPVKAEKVAGKSAAKKSKPPVAPFVPGSWTIAIMPDIQHYSTYYPGLTRLQTQWIVENKEKHNIVYVLQNGDLTNHNTPKEWKRASRGLGILDGVVPYALVPGNHDYAQGNAKDRSTRINNYFPPSRFQDWPTFGGTMAPGHIENNYHLFEAGGIKWIIVGLEFGPRDATLQWADQILKKYSDRKAIVFTHAYLYCDSTRLDWAKKEKTQQGNPHKYGTAGGVNDGEEMWNKLLRKHANLFMVINGHIAGDGLGFQVSKGDHGNLVNEMSVNYQRQPLKGGAWLRLLEFRPDGKTVQARTYSPLYEEHKTDEQNQFIFTIK
ncbi:MAG: metallophosphoesterase [Pirellulales bacterium]|nr:metallophosphoesterase [Pirellulales bacterium]